MTDIFCIKRFSDQEDADRKGVYLAIEIRVAGVEMFFPVSKVCHSQEELDREKNAIKGHLDSVIDSGKAHFTQSRGGDAGEITPDMSRDAIWDILSSIEDEDRLIERFNSLDGSTRRKVAEYVLTECNIFEANASLFSAHYNNDTGFMD